MKFVTRAGLACAAAGMLAATAAANPWLCHHRLGGAWVGAWVGQDSGGAPARIELAMIFAPLDPLGLTASIQLEWLTVGSDFENLNALLNGKRSQVVGQAMMVDRDSTRYTFIWYVVSQDNPEQIVAITTLSGHMDFDGPNKLVDQSTLRLYLTNAGVDRVAPLLEGNPWPYGDADADHDLLPDDGAIPFVAVPYIGALSKRVPLLAP
jgi:hypothetical protein